MGIDYYFRFGTGLLDAEYPDVHDIFGWLDDAQGHQGLTHSILWSRILTDLFSKNDWVREHYSQVTTCVEKYFTYLLQIDPKEFVELSVSSEFVSTMCSLRSGESQAIVAQLVSSGWNPSPLLAKFVSITAAALQQKSSQLHFPATLENIGSGQFFQTLVPLLSSDISKYTIPPDSNYCLLLEVHRIEGEDIEHLDSQIHFLKNMAALVPNKLPQILMFLIHQDDLKRPHFEALFPLRLDASQDKEYAENVLKALLTLIIDERSDTGQHTLNLLREHHPELGSLVDMHLSIFPDASWKNTYAEILVPAYWAWLHSNSLDHKQSEEMQFSAFESL